MKKDILQDILAAKIKDLEEAKKRVTLRELCRRLDSLLLQGEPPVRSLRDALMQSPTGIIAEFKRKSPSKGWIAREASPLYITGEYECNGAAALSVLTEERFFGGSREDFLSVRAVRNLPMLRKDFIIDEYQLFESKLMGADVVLLIAACLSMAQYRMLSARAKELGLEVLLEIHGEEELSYVERGASLVGVNNRHLGSFETDVENSFHLAELLPADIVKVSESGLSNPHSVVSLRQKGYRGFLMGEHFMRAPHVGTAMKEFVEEVAVCK